MARFAATAATATACAFPLLVHIGAVRDEPAWTAIGIALVVSSALATRLAVLTTALVGLFLVAFILAMAHFAPAAIVHAPPVLLNLFLCAFFAATLRANREPLVSAFARLEHGGPLPPDLTRYTRTLTWIWVAFFALMAAVSLLLAVWGTVMAWSLFTNVVNYVFVGVFFVCEYAYRRVRYRQYIHATPLELARSIRAHGLGLRARRV